MRGGDCLIEPRHQWVKLNEQNEVFTESAFTAHNDVWNKIISMCMCAEYVSEVEFERIFVSSLPRRL